MDTKRDTLTLENFFHSQLHVHVAFLWPFSFAVAST